MTLSRRVTAALVIMAGFAVHAFAGGFQLNEMGARAMAQGGAFAARASDGSAIYFNPAGLGFQQFGSAYFGATVIVPTTSFYGPTQDNSNQRTKMNSQAFTPINGYVTYPIMDRLHIGIGVNNPFGLGTSWPLDWPGKYLSTKVYLRSFFFTPTVAYRVNDQLSVGAGINYVTGSVTLEQAVASPIDDPRASLNMSGHGWGFNLGAMYKITPELSAGVSARSEVKIDATGDASFNPAYSLFPAGGASTSIRLPATAFVGLAYKVTQNLELEADYQYIGWQSYHELTIHFDKDGSESVSTKNYQATYILRIGGEYTMDVFHFRAGYLYDHSPVPTDYVEPLLPDANRHGINIGVGTDISSQLSLDVAYMFLSFEQRKAEHTIPEINFDGTYNTYASLFAINIGYKL